MYFSITIFLNYDINDTMYLGINILTTFSFLSALKRAIKKKKLKRSFSNHNVIIFKMIISNILK